MLTLGNLFSGTLAVISLLNGGYEIAAVCILISLILDFLDGFVARALKANSNLGVQLDSLADMVSFGVVPGITMFLMMQNFSDAGNEAFENIKYSGLLITLFSCLRLAIFNLDEEQRYYFKGLNTPTNTIFIFGLYYVHRKFGTFGSVVENLYILLLITALCSWLLLSPIKMISLKFKSMQLKDNYAKIALLIGVLVLLTVFKFPGIPLAVIYYVLISALFQKELSK